MKWLSLFDGISCGRLALERAGLPVTRYVAYEIDRHAIEVSRWNWNDIEHAGNVEGADFTKYRGFDVVMGGFPCTDLSQAKNDRKGLAGKSSRLFWEQVRAIKEVKPKYFLVENNYGMPKADERIITEALGVTPVLINSALVSAQNRRRLYWTNIGEISQPADKGIRLADVLQSRVAAKYYHTADALDYMNRGNRNHWDYGYHQASDDSKSSCITANIHKGVTYNVLAVAIRTHPCTKTPGVQRHKRPEVQPDGKSNALTSVAEDSMAIFQRPRGYNKGGTHSEKSPTLTANRWESNNLLAQPGAGFVVKGGFMAYKGRQVPVKLPDGDYVMRRLTPVECERLQTLSDGYTEIVSDTQRYKQLGNGWTVDVIAHILGHIDDHLL